MPSFLFLAAQIKAKATFMCSMVYNYIHLITVQTQLLYSKKLIISENLPET